MEKKPIIRLEGEHMKHILLTGAAGSVGYSTLKELMKLPNILITATDLETKKNRQKLNQWQDKINIIYGSITDSKFVETLIQGQDIIIHLAAIIPPLADKNPELTRQVNYFGTKSIVDAIKKYHHGFLIYSSSISVYGDRVENPWITVSDTLAPSFGDYYAYVKIETEKMIEQANIPYTIFRLTGIMDHPILDPLMFHMPLDTKLEIATVNDTGYAFAMATTKLEKLNGKIFNLGGGPNCRTTYREFIAHMFQIYGIKLNYLKEFAFAEKNFHCGYYQDGNELNQILNFQRDTLEHYYKKVREETNPITRFFSKLFSRPIVFFLNKKSEPLNAKKEHNKNLMHRFFK